MYVEGALFCWVMEEIGCLRYAFCRGKSQFDVAAVRSVGGLLGVSKHMAQSELFPPTRQTILLV